jgi:hypothetical protein
LENMGALSNANGAPCARITAPTEMRGITSLTTRSGRAPITGARTGLAGFSDDHQRLCFALALWNGKDFILKERLFGLTNNEGNHGEDVKEYYYYLDSTPTHSYMKYLYKYPQNAYPYSDLIENNRRRGRNDQEFELIEHGYLQRKQIFRHRCRVCQSGARRHLDSDQRNQSRTRAGRDPPSADALVSKYLELVARSAKAITKADN